MSQTLLPLTPENFQIILDRCLADFAQFKQMREELQQFTYLQDSVEAAELIAAWKEALSKFGELLSSKFDCGVRLIWEAERNEWEIERTVEFVKIFSELRAMKYGDGYVKH